MCLSGKVPCALLAAVMFVSNTVDSQEVAPSKARAAMRPNADPPRLQFQIPEGFRPGFTGGTGGAPETYGAWNADALMHVYPFRTYDGDFAALVRQTLLRDWVPAMYRTQGQLVQQPGFQPVRVVGADEALLVNFELQEMFTVHCHVFLALHVANFVSMVDLYFRDPHAYERYRDATGRLFSTIQVVRSAPSPTPRTANDGLAGIYMYTGLTLGARTETEFYMLSGDGRVHRGTGVPRVPNGDIRQFDYDFAMRSQPFNTGTYTLQGPQIMMRFAQASPPGVTATRGSAGDLVIYNRSYQPALAHKH